MIVCLIIIIIILLLILFSWWVYKNNNYNKNSFKNSLTPLESLNNHLSYNTTRSQETYIGNIDDSIEEINNSILNNNLEFNNTLYEKKNMPSYKSAKNNDLVSIPIYQGNSTHGTDYDESNASQGIKRNDPLRPTIGIINRGTMMDSFLREELTDAEGKEWWGNGDW